MGDSKSLGNVVVAMYRPKPRKDAALRKLIAKHLPVLRKQKLATKRPAMLLQASDGTYLEIFEWVPGGAEKAHTNPAVLAVWGPMHDVCDFVTLADLPESEGPFPHFRAVDGVTR
jgi:hypothetical protein